MSALPIRIGLLYDYPQAGDLFVKALRMGIDDVAASGRLDRDFEFVERQVTKADEVLAAVREA